MTQLTAPIAVFANPDAEIWGILVGGEQAQLAIAPLDAAGPGNPEGITATFTTVSVDPDDGDVWSINGQDTELRIELAGASTYTHEDGSALIPCRVTGTASLTGRTLELDLPGVLLPELPSGKIDSIRMIGSWFPAGHEISLLSIRPKGAKGQSSDSVDVVARGEQHPLVFDPRLSTTYAADGTPRVTGIELWLGDDEDSEQHPRRVSGVCTGSAASTPAATYTLQAHALHCLSRGEEGSGVYVLMHAA